MIVDKNNITITTSTTTRSCFDDSADALRYWANNFTQSIQNIKIPNCDEVIRGIWHIDDTNTKGNEDNMEENKVLELYYDRKREQIDKEYDEKRKEAYNNLDVVKEFNEVVKEFETTLAEMANRYNTEETKYLLKDNCYSNHYGYELNDDISATIGVELSNKRKEALEDLCRLRNEVNAQLSLSNDKDYQIEVLKNYNIIDKKTGKLNV